VRARWTGDAHRAESGRNGFGSADHNDCCALHDRRVFFCSTSREWTLYFGAVDRWCGARDVSGTAGSDHDRHRDMRTNRDAADANRRTDQSTCNLSVD